MLDFWLISTFLGDAEASKVAYLSVLVILCLLITTAQLNKGGVKGDDCMLCCNFA